MNTKKAEPKEKYFDIVAGPNKDILFDACKYSCSKVANVPVNFTVAFGYTTPPGHPRFAYVPMKITDIKILGIEHEDGSGESFNLHGHCKTNMRPSDGNTAYATRKFKAYYNSKKRTGSITFPE